MRARPAWVNNSGTLGLRSGPVCLKLCSAGLWVPRSTPANTRYPPSFSAFCACITSSRKTPRGAHSVGGCGERSAAVAEEALGLPTHAWPQELRVRRAGREAAPALFQALLPRHPRGDLCGAGAGGEGPSPGPQSQEGASGRLPEASLRLAHGGTCGPQTFPEASAPRWEPGCAQRGLGRDMEVPRPLSLTGQGREHKRRLVPPTPALSA